MLWLCIHLPWLPLEVFTRGADDGDTPLAVVCERYIRAVNAAGRRAGVLPGMGLAAARSVAPQLHLRDRDTGAEASALERLAGWALQFTSRLSLQPPSDMLLEIGASLRYFGGLETLRGLIGRGLEELGYHARLGIAPTPTAAWLLARAADEQPVTAEAALRERLGPLPVAALDLDDVSLSALRGLGVTTLADCLALPRPGLGRRLGQGLLTLLDRALGQLPDPRHHWQAPARYSNRIELSTEVENTAYLIFGLNRLIRELCGQLRGGENGTQHLQITLDHLHQPATPFAVGLVTPSRDPEHLLALTRERLERITLPAPVIGLGLATRDIRPLAPRPRPLLTADSGQPAESWNTLVERLSARLGEHAIQGLRTHSEHRPERAWGYTRPGGQAPADAMAERPLWLLARPMRLSVTDGRPQWHGALILHRGPERIESGWWDGNDIARDYYVAVNAAGERVWIYRERRGGRDWFLHGLFA